MKSAVRQNMVRNYIFHSIAVLCMVTMGLLWYRFITAFLPERVFDLQSSLGLIPLLVGSYIIGWIIYLVESGSPKLTKIGNCVLTTTSVAVFVCLFEIPALLGIVDYRFVSLDLGVGFKPWENPRFQIDSELLWRPRPYQRFSGRSGGDLGGSTTER